MKESYSKQDFDNGRRFRTTAYFAAVAIVSIGFSAKPVTASTAYIQLAQTAPAESTTPKRDMRDSSNQQKDGPKGEPKEPQTGQSGNGKPGSTPGPNRFSR